MDDATDGKGSKQGFPLGPVFIFLGVLLVSFAYFAFGKNAESVSLEGNIALPVLFAIGLVTGIHCIGMCGSFVVAYSTKNGMAGSADRSSHIKYGAGKLISYTAMGAVFGLIGSVLSFTPQMRGAIGVLAGAFLLIYGLNMLNVFPVLRKLQLRLPSFANFEKMQDRGPFMIGLANGLFLACGPLQAMYIYASGSGSVLNGAASLFAFGLGTLPLMMLFGFSISSLTKYLHGIIKFSGVLVLVLGLVMANTGLTLLGHGINLKDFIAPAPLVNSTANITQNITNSTQNTTNVAQDVQEIRMTVDGNGFTPDIFTLQKGVKVRWIINATQLTNCNKEIIVRDYGLDIKLHAGENVVEFTPDNAGTIHWSCWMGMIPGTFIVQ
ncbi:Cytochrome C biogenesis protein transmembrane region [uncultured archaeon]|nr:Cytochrome C biogenesis protein transmembrane region [uncultured archaeon]